jgi:hypothetical protein
VEGDEPEGGEAWDIRRVLMTQIGLVQMVDEAPPAKAAITCVTKAF